MLPKRKREETIYTATSRWYSCIIFLIFSFDSILVPCFLPVPFQQINNISFFSFFSSYFFFRVGFFHVWHSSLLALCGGRNINTAVGSTSYSIQSCTARVIWSTDNHAVRLSCVNKCSCVHQVHRETKSGASRLTHCCLYSFFHESPSFYICMPIHWCLCMYMIRYCLQHWAMISWLLGRLKFSPHFFSDAHRFEKERKKEYKKHNQKLK